jgi:hypothetical protein
MGRIEPGKGRLSIRYNVDTRTAPDENRPKECQGVECGKKFRRAMRGAADDRKVAVGRLHLGKAVTEKRRLAYLPNPLEVFFCFFCFGEGDGAGCRIGSTGSSLRKARGNLACGFSGLVTF